jgi:hypothetical protein
MTDDQAIGFAALPPHERRRKGGLGGFRAQQRGTAHQWSKAEASAAGRSGRPAVRRAIALLEEAGYRCTRAAGSLAIFDLVAVGSSQVRLIRVWSGKKQPSKEDRARILAFDTPNAMIVTRECWSFVGRQHPPAIERL